MSATDALQALNCPRCGGMVPIPDGQTIVICPFCNLRSVVSGEHGLRWYQAPVRVDREQAETAFKEFLDSTKDIAADAARKARSNEVILIHLPFWAVWGGVAGHFLGYTDKDKEIRPLEKHTVENLAWNVAACDVGEFGVSHINLEGCLLEPFDSEALHRAGMVFEPLGSAKEISEAAQDKLIDQLITSHKQPNASQEFARIIESCMGLVYYPLWVVRYLYNGRVFQVVVDGYSGEVLYGQAPANTLHRATVMVFKMALGSIMVAAAAGLANIFIKNIQISLFCIAVALPWLVLLVYGAAFMYHAWDKYKYRGHYKFVRLKSGTGTPRVLSKASQGQNDTDDLIENLEGLI